MKTFDQLVRLGVVLFALAFARVGGSATIQVTNTAASGPGSFQQAILTANANTGLDTIVFQISGAPPFIIRPTSALPALTDPVVIDATTQPGYAGKPVIELDGASTSGGTIGLRCTAGYSTLRGLAISQFPVQAIELDGPSNVIQGNFIGTDVTGMIQNDNGVCGILVKSAGNLIGGTNAGNGNLISPGAIPNSAGIYILGAGNNIVQGNLIGVNAAGTGAFNSVYDGIILYASGGNLIGGPVAAARNIISGNGASGIYLTGANTAGNVIQGNYLGTGISGSTAVRNVRDGITLVSAPGNMICSNLISGNGAAGVSLQGASSNQLFGNFIGTDVTGEFAVSNYNLGVFISGGGWNQIGGTNPGAGNVISGNPQHGIALTGGTSTNLIQGNLIGLTAAGNSGLGNAEDGIAINGGTGNTIGGTTAGARNVISGNGSNGVDIVQLTDSGNVVLGNYIGTDVTGTQSIGNKLTGVLIEGCSNLIGGTVAGAGNVISGNSQVGLWLVGTNGNVKGNVIQGNLIGLTAAGTAGLGNGVSSLACAGIGISTASANLVGGLAPGAANVISANNGAGIFLVGTATGSNLVQGNFIGTDPTGTVGLGNAFAGIYLEQAATNQLGGSVPGAGNVISGNLNQGIFLNNASWNVVQGNLIGTKADGASNLGNQTHNIELQAGANDNVIGGTAAGAGNRLAFASMYYMSSTYHLYCGVRVRTGATNDFISGNSIFSNGALGIDLSPTDGGTAAGVNPIVPCEDGVAADAANAGQNFPTLSNIYSGTITRVSGSLNSKISQTYTLQFFASSAGNSSGYGEGQVYLGQTNLMLGSASCSSNFTAYLPVSVPAGWVVTATATDPNNNTSEFSAWVPVISLPRLQQSLSRPSHFALSWTNNGGSFALQQTTNLTPPVVWLPVTNVPVLVTNFMVTTLSATNRSVFYRLIAP
jgi:parallel beta-helix repeat protein